MEFAIITICYLAGFVFVLFCFYQLAGLLDKLACQEANTKVWFLRSSFIHNGSPVRSPSLDILIDHQFVPSSTVVSHDMLKLLSHTAYMDPPSRRKWDRAWTNKSKLKTNCTFRSCLNFSVCPIRMTNGHINGPKIRTRCGFLTELINFQTEQN